MSRLPGIRRRWFVGMSAVVFASGTGRIGVVGATHASPDVSGVGRIGVVGTTPASPDVGRPGSGRVQGDSRNSGPGIVANEPPAQRLSSIVGVAVGEYGKGVGAHGELISAEERDEATGFLTDAAEVAARLPGEGRLGTSAVLDTLMAAMRAQRPLGEVQAIYQRFTTALGSAGALEMPRDRLDVAGGGATYARACASCHGLTGHGDGPAARSLSTAPPPIGLAAAMRNVSPALMYRLVSVGVRGTAMPAWASTLTPAERWNLVAYVASMRATSSQVRQGEGLYFQRCASCHGAAAAGAGMYAPDLTTIPPEIGAFAWQADRSDSEIAQAITNGVPGTVMPPSRDLTTAEVGDIVAYLHVLPTRAVGIPGTIAAQTVAAGDTSAAALAAQSIMTQLNGALVAARGGRTSDARDRAFDSYIAFEPLEPPAQAKNPGLVSALERQFADFKGAIRLNDLRTAEHARDAIEVGLPEVVALTKRTAGGWSAFLQSFLIIVREGFEAILVVGAVVAFLIKTGHRDRLRSIWTGAVLGIAASGVTAVILATVLRALPASREIIEGATLLVAVAVLFSVSYWLVSKVEAAHWQQFIRDKVSTALSQGGGKALGFVAFLAVYREGAETALFYQALFNEGHHVALPLSLGIIIGGIVLAVIFTLFYRFGVRIPLRPFFTVTGALLYYMAFVFAGKGVRELQEGGALPITLLPGFPHVEAMGIFPSVETLLAQVILLALLAFALIKTFWPKRSVALPTVAVTAPLPQSSDPMRARSGAVDGRVAALEAAVENLHRRLVEIEEEGKTVVGDR
jgi:FTR1 family protein